MFVVLSCVFCDVEPLYSILREGKYMSMRGLARKIGISSTTMASIMSRKPKDVSVEFLQKVAKAFGVDWQEFYGYEPEIYDKYKEKRVSSFVTEDYKDYFLYHMLGSAYDEMKDRENAEIHRAVEQAVNKQGLSVENLPHDNAFYTGILLLLKDLNLEGLKDVLGYTLQISKNENYLKKE